MKQKRRCTSVKLLKRRRTTVKLSCGCYVAFEFKPKNGKYAVLVDYPEGSRLKRETLTHRPPAA
jgi:hypothetical protein